MNIIWNKNPLRTVIELDEHEKKEFWLKIKIKEMEEDMGSAAVFLDPKNASWTMTACHRHPQLTLETLIEQVLNDYLDMDYFLSEDDGTKSPLDKRVDELFAYYMDDLVSSHCGDCTCFPMSCSKCQAEELLGIDTIKGLGKHSAHKIGGAFGKDDERTMDEALETLRTYDPKRINADTDPAWEKVGGFEQHVPRWKAEAKVAYEWLLAYRDEHFPEKA